MICIFDMALVKMMLSFQGLILFAICIDIIIGITQTVNIH